MMKRILSLVLCLLLAAGMVATAEEAAQADTTTGTPWMDPEVLGNVTEDTPGECDRGYPHGPEGQLCPVRKQG